MKTAIIFFVSILSGGFLCAADMRYSRAEALAQLKSSLKTSQVVFIAKTEMRGKQRVLVCLETIKSSQGLPAVGEALLVDAPLRGPEGREGIVFMPAYPVPSFSGEIRWLRGGNLNECRELSLQEIKEVLLKKK